MRVLFCLFVWLLLLLLLLFGVCAFVCIIPLVPPGHANGDGFSLRLATGWFSHWVGGANREKFSKTEKCMNMQASKLLLVGMAEEG